MSAGTGGRAAWRLQAWITGILALALLVVGNHLARGHLRWRLDLSEDQLYAPSPVAERLIGELRDVLRVKAFFTGDVKSGRIQIAKRRLMDQLEELVELGEGRVELTYVDPNDSSEARVEAEALGLVPKSAFSQRGTSVVAQDVWLGLALRYRGGEVVVPFVVPEIFEYVFLTGLRKLTREEEVTVGFLVGRGDGGGADGLGAADPFAELRALCVQQYRLREVLDLERGEPVPEAVSVLVVARPTELHPRAAFAIDQFVQRGGRLLLLVDRQQVDLAQGTVTPIETGVGALLEAWGAPVGEGLLWDVGRCKEVSVSGGRLPFPLWPRVPAEGLDRATPATAEVGEVAFFWAHPILPGEVEGLTRTTLAESSADTWVVPADESVWRIDPARIGARTSTLAAGGPGEPRTIAVSLSGRFPSPFAGGAPAPLDEVTATLHADRVRRAREEGREPPPAPAATTDEPVLERAAAGQVVVVGDSDWASHTDTFPFLGGENALLFVNLVDWLALEDDLLALRARLPVERRLDDFLQEEREALGIVGPRPEGFAVSQEIARLEVRAERSAAARRWRAMSTATSGSLGLAVLLWLLWRLVALRAPAGAAGRAEEGTR